MGELAAILRIGESNLRRLVRQGKIPHIELGPRTIRFDPEAIDAWRKKFFDIGGYQDGVEKTAREQILDVSMTSKRHKLDSFNKRDRQEKGTGQGSRASHTSRITEKAASEITKILKPVSGDRKRS